MALNLYAGRPGSGKSYSVVEYVVIPALKKGRHVVTNIPLRDELLTQVYGGQVTQLPLDALDNPELPDLVPHGAVVIVDECWNRWPSGQKVSNAPKNDLHWLKEHRHRVDENGNAMQVILVTQDASDLASWVRKLVAHSFYMTKLEEVGQSKRFSIKVYKGCPTGDRIPSRYLVREALGTYKPEIYQFYSSATQSQTLDVGDEKVMDKRTNIWGSGSMITTMVFCAFAFIAGPWMMYNYFAPKLEAAEEPPVDQVVLVNPPPDEIAPGAAIAQPSTQPQVVQAVQYSGPPASTHWRIAGYLKRETPEPGKMPSQAMLANMSGSVRYFPLDSCKPYPDGIDYSCVVDGELVTPWSGKQGLTQGFKESAGLEATATTVKAAI